MLRVTKSGFGRSDCDRSSFNCGHDPLRVELRQCKYHSGADKVTEHSAFLLVAQRDRSDLFAWLNENSSASSLRAHPLAYNEPVQDVWVFEETWKNSQNAQT